MPGYHDIEDSCRLCLAQSDNMKFKAIFPEIRHNGVSLAMKIMVCVSLTVLEEDPYPNWICNKCETSVNSFYAFREACSRAHLTLIHCSQKPLTIQNQRNVSESSIDFENACSEPPHLLNPSTKITESKPQVDQLDLPDECNGSCSPADTENNKLQSQTEERVKYTCSSCESNFDNLDEAATHYLNGCASSESTSATFKEETINESSEHKNTEIVTHPSISNKELQENHTERVLIEPKKSQHKRKNSRLQISNHPCSSCDRSFRNASLLRRHSSVHTGERPFACEICQRRFAQLGQLNFHRNFHSNPRYRCGECQKPFLRPSDIEKHMRTHTGEKPFHCEICSKSFTQLGALQQHARVHSGEKPYCCDTCGKRFAQRANLTKHVKIHREGERPHTCEVCGRSFRDLGEMELHKAGHGGGKPRKCEHCESSFRKESELKHHIRRFHDRERSHKCMLCAKAFFSTYNLKQHMMVHTGQRPYACAKCDLRFTQKGNLTKHFERKHAESVADMQRYVLVGEKSDCEEEIFFFEENEATEVDPDDPLMVEYEVTVDLETNSGV